MRKNGVSPMVATVVLIGITFSLAATLFTAINSWRRPSPDFNGDFIIENAEDGSEGLRIVHGGGTSVLDAFGVENSEVSWNNLVLKVNGVSENITCCYATESGSEVVDCPEDDSEPSIDLTPGDEFEVGVTDAIGRPLESGDSITLVFAPKGQIVVLTNVTPS